MQTFEQDQLMECPQCSKKALVKHSGNIYQCLNCRFKRDLSDVIANGETNWFLIFILAIALLLGIAGQTPESQRSTQFQPATSGLQNRLQ